MVLEGSASGDGERLASPGLSARWITPGTGFKLVENLLDALL
jgi:hypothetical protein